jgi:hypothetical protein
MTVDRVSRVVLHVSIETISFSSFDMHMLPGLGISLRRSSQSGNILAVVLIQLASSCEDLANKDMIARLRLSAVESLAMIDPDRQMDFKIPSEPSSPKTTFTIDICLLEVSSVWSCFYDSADPSQYAARDFVCSQYNGSHIANTLQTW